MQSAVRRGYGWGWDPELRGTDAKHPTSRPVSMQPLGTPAAALMLLWAGQMLDEPKYIEAANQAARGIATAQLPAGKIPAMPTFAATAGGRDEPAIIPDRASTRAALGLLLSILDDSTKPHDERIDRAARRAAQWMLNQQTDIRKSAPAIGENSQYFPTSPSEYAGADFQGYIADSPWGEPLERSEFHIFTTFVQSSTTQQIPILLDGDDGHSLFVNDTFVGGGGFDVDVNYNLVLNAAAPVKVEVGGFNGPGDWVFFFGNSALTPLYD